MFIKYKTFFLKFIVARDLTINTVCSIRILKETIYNILETTKLLSYSLRKIFG